jgi:hypothetical protein
MGFTACKMWRPCTAEIGRSCSKNGRSSLKTKDPAQKQTILLKSEIPQKFCFEICPSALYIFTTMGRIAKKCHHVQLELWQRAIAAKSFIMYI